ncbi:MAG: hypothetical protein A2845_02750 [Candidatus Lloydbacteria bacterium RIFCSPHIGHO2_01_FULL_49_22]|uniref:POTRA domain-containing protein n=1 Tax=Candidatus Lloydbacteria bacterium RIFCSPHIGHO2_01_FULL_49_22 TaxID=1798658 RepID=A0A1G2CV21_9BACT|nr:MAG: hypothetical protein A2845_02750 [Candidatus Lloydbacteria bacterium RIFCSPHIGHO2_01_FULL_49_22]OGZ10367.1 MAG: hypothetical protein A3C14_02450 [Candidatus Lloydbacteria bacterium RIFCSPHIGHO2_02_FULL_50_18]
MRRIDLAFERLCQFLLIGYFLFFAVSWGAEREAIRISTIEVSGAVASSADEIRNIAQKLLSEKILWRIDRNNALFYPSSELSLALLAFDAHIKAVDMNVEAKKILKINIIEYLPKHLWCMSGAEASTTDRGICYLADSEGYVFALAPEYSGYPFDIYRTNIAGESEQDTPIGLFMLPKEELERVYAVIAELEKEGIFVHEIDQLDEHDYSFTSDKPWIFSWTSSKDPSASVANLKLAEEEIARTKKGTTTVKSIDLRFGNKIFYK